MRRITSTITNHFIKLTMFVRRTFPLTYVIYSMFTFTPLRFIVNPLFFLRVRTISAGSPKLEFGRTTKSRECPYVILLPFGL